jgi:segregation and condensation protein B
MNQDESGRDYSTQAPPAAVDGRLLARIEALLFVAPGPTSVEQLAAALEVQPAAIEGSLEFLERGYAFRGLRLQRHRGAVQLTTAPDLAGDVERFLQLESISRLSRAALEVLAIVGYEQPITVPRSTPCGVNSDSVLRTLLRHGLIQEAGRSSGPGRPILYETGPEFLQHFGLGSLKDLPPLFPEAVQELEGRQPEVEEAADSSDAR